ncbi:nitroreductase [Kordiimonas sp. SCSIO 12610]|uniref:nitroreductase n=1 Tax=Kordiimonas sp. SCSIO 12610 TaxID=2829597 RepID=UPI002108DE3F|nr:nitroreductase [Kordiimonas sp. SCSIO 12610]UTW55614.1 nitroreductase [Kordiimonas sp. SCSIO 12610]
MSVGKLLETRKSVRAYLDKPVSSDLLVNILEQAKQSPSGGNVQPWHVHVVSGEVLYKLKLIVQKKLSENPMGDGMEYHIYPESLKEPYRTRRYECGEALYKTIGIEHDNKFGRLMHVARNFEFFGAPVGMFFTIDRAMGRPQWVHLGMFMQTFMLLAEENGLATCPQEAWTMMHKTVADFLNLPDEQMLYAGMALGYEDTKHPINSLRTDRAKLEEFTVFHEN